MATTQTKQYQHPFNEKPRDKEKSDNINNKKITNRSPHSFINFIHMKYRIPSRNNPNTTNYHRSVSIDNILNSNRNGIQGNSNNHTRRKRRMSHTNNPHKWSLIILHYNICPYRPRDLLFIPSKPTKSMDIRSGPHTYNYSNRILRIRPSMRTNIILRGDGNYRSPLRHSNRRNRTSSMNLRRFISIRTNTKPILLTTLYFTNNNHRNRNNSPNPTTRERILQPNKHKNKHRQSKI
jgi:hypothetical protein